MLIDMETLVRGLGGAALMFPRRAVTVELDLQSEPVWVKFVSLTDEMLPICCDDAGSLLPALRWYQCRGERLLRVAVMAPQFFWFPLMGSIGTR
ncbi:hypothetical protein SAMN05421553_0198 [Pseudomonas anguilliseptica]|uniref:Uncharacterized protein n=2 Tax=Pseudomonas anguilliseptica TaxID=53406 RepID=A0A1H4P5U0_PSEAG|nr:hypothetical protein SAMN05421553_0198 [Pseudomonas anguilliseptica]